MDPRAGRPSRARPTECRHGPDPMTLRHEEAALRRSQTLQAFNVYRTAAVADVLDRPRTYAFVDGVAVRCAVRVISADPGGVVLSVGRNHLTAMERAQMVLLESPLHGATFRTAIDEVDPLNGYVSVSRLQPCGKHHERRAVARAVPGLAMPVRVHTEAHEAMGRVVDLSPSAVAADFEHDRFLPLSLATSVRLDVSGDPDETSELESFVADARIRRTSEREHRGLLACRAVFEFDSYPALDRVLRRYVARRQLHVLTGLLAAGGDRPPANL